MLVCWTGARVNILNSRLFSETVYSFYANGEESKEGLVVFGAFGYLMENDNGAIYSIEKDIELLNTNLAENIIDSEIFKCVYMKA